MEDRLEFIKKWAKTVRDRVLANRGEVVRYNRPPEIPEPPKPPEVAGSPAGFRGFGAFLPWPIVATRSCRRTPGGPDGSWTEPATVAAAGDAVDALQAARERPSAAFGGPQGEGHGLASAGT